MIHLPEPFVQLVDRQDPSIRLSTSTATLAQHISDHYHIYRAGSDWTGASTTPPEWTCSPWPTTLAIS
eukprot:2644595-Pyramimonas_sp.AAC.1